MAENEAGEFVEIHFFVGVRVNSEQIPKDIVKFSLGGFLKDFNEEVLKLIFSKMTL